MKPLAASPLAPVNPYVWNCCSPFVLAMPVVFSSCSTMPVQIMRVSRHKLRCVSISSLWVRRPAAAHSSPSEKIPPLWVFTPPVALNIACSQARPVGLMARSVCGPASRAVSLPTLKNVENQGAIAAMLVMNSAKSMSLCAPLFTRSTRPGFGVKRISRYMASAASSATVR